MRTIIITIALCLLTALSGKAQSGDIVYIDNFGINVGTQKLVSIKLANPENKFCAFQFDLNLPNGIKVALDKNGKLDVKLNGNRKMNDHTLSVEKIGDGCYRLVCFSMSNSEFYGNSGSIVDLTVESTVSSASSPLIGSVDNIVLTQMDGSDVKPVNSSFKVNTVIGALRGDVNGDGEENIKDAIFVTKIILGTEDATEAADVNNDGKINIQDVMFIVNYIKNGEFPDE